MLPILQIGPLTAPTGPLLLIVGFWVCYQLAEKDSPRFGITPVWLGNFTAIGLVTTILIGRLAYANNHFEAFAAAPLSLFSPNPAMFDWPSGVLAGVTAAWLYANKSKINLWLLLDMLSPALALFAVFLGLTHLATGDAYGSPADLPWAIWLWEAYRHPSQIYETIAAGMIFLWIWSLHRREPRVDRYPGGVFLRLVAGLAGSRLFLEAFRGDSQTIFATYRTAQVTAWLVLAGSLTALILRVKILSPEETKPYGPSHYS